MLAFGGRQIEELSVGWSVDVDTGSGTARMTIPVLPPRARLMPSLVLTYASGGRNSAFGFGWSLSGLPSIGLDTSRHVPRWDGTDSYQWGGDELVPWLALAGGGWAARGFDRGDWSVAFYRSRRGGSQTRVEKWLHRPTGRVHFRTRTADNLLTVYGARTGNAARIADPASDERTLTWQPELAVDANGNAMWLEYAAETADGVDRAGPGERAQPSLAQRYLKRIRYGNAAPFALDDATLAGMLPAGLRWCFQLVLDYGDHDPNGAPVATPDRAWPARADPFSVNRNGFELRTYRLCRRLLSFHDFAELGPAPAPVAALTLSYAQDPAGSTLVGAARVGYRTDAGAVSARTIPGAQLSYAQPGSDAGFLGLPLPSLENVPAGFAARNTSFVDLFGDGLAGILQDADRAWFYKPNWATGISGRRSCSTSGPRSCRAISASATSTPMATPIFRC